VVIILPDWGGWAVGPRRRFGPQPTAGQRHQRGMDGLDFLVRYGYAVLFTVVLGEQLGLPLVGAPVLMAAGALAGVGRFSLTLAVGLAVTACLLGDLVWFELGRRRGAPILSFLCRISLEPDSCIRRTEDIFSRWGARVLLVAKFIPGLNTVAPPLAGVVGMPRKRFLRWDLGGATAWTLVYVGLGYLFSAQIEAVAFALAGLGRGAAIIVGVALVAYVGLKYWQRHRFIRSLRIARIPPEELLARMKGDAPMMIIDLRNLDHLASEGLRIPGSIHMNPDDLARRHAEIPRDEDIALYCS
jgi:membrane protein DedA with SNARE-associated domain